MYVGRINHIVFSLVPEYPEFISHNFVIQFPSTTLLSSSFFYLFMFCFPSGTIEKYLADSPGGQQQVLAGQSSAGGTWRKFCRVRERMSCGKADGVGLVDQENMENGSFRMWSKGYIERIDPTRTENMIYNDIPKGGNMKYKVTTRCGRCGSDFCGASTGFRHLHMKPLKALMGLGWFFSDCGDHPQSSTTAAAPSYS